MATVAIQQPTPPRSPMIRKRTFSASSDGMHYGPRVSKQPKTVRQQFSPQRKRKQPPPEEKKKSVDSAFVDGAKVDLGHSFVPPAASKRDRYSAAKESQAGLEKKCAERQAMAATVSDEWTEKVSMRQPGFDNIRMSRCYRHSLLQALLHIPKLVNWLLEFHKLGECCSQRPTVCLACKLRDLATLYWIQNSSRQEIYALLKDIDRTLAIRGWATDNPEEYGDPDDQFTAMLEMMSEDMGAMGHTRFQAIHSTLLTSSIRCSSCGHTTDPHHSAERTLSVPLEAGLSGSGLDAFIAAFLRDKISGYRCEGCQKSVNVTRDVKIASPADVISVQLKRAGWNGTVKTKVGITRVLDLTKHAVDPSTQLRYELVSTVSHQGNSRFGHYIAHAVGPDGKWTEFNDECTRKVSPKAVLMPPGFKPVLLYYKRVQKTPSPAAGSPLTQAIRAPSSAAPTISASFSRTPGGREQARPSSPNYFGHVVDSGNNARDSGTGHKDNGSPTVSSVHSYVEKTPRNIPLESNVDFEAFRKQSEANQSFNLGHGNLSHFSSAPVLPAHAHGYKSAAGHDRNTEAKRTNSAIAINSDSWLPPRSKSHTFPTESPSILGIPMQESPMDTGSSQPLAPVREHTLSEPGDKHPRLSLPGGRPSPSTPHTSQQNDIPRAVTLPPVLQDGPAFISAPDLRGFLETQNSSDYLLLDLRVAPQYSQSRIRNALNLCIPTTLLKRPSFNLAKLTETFKVPDEKAQFSRWSECGYIIVYDSHSADKKDAVAALNTIKKFTNEGWNGRAYILKGGFKAFSAIQSDAIDQKPAHDVPNSKNLSLGPLFPNATDVAGGCEMPQAKSVANPFFSNIRQNMDLVGGVGQIDVRRPDDVDQLADDFVPMWLRSTTDREDHGKAVSDKFLRIEQTELSRMQNALSSRVSYGTPTSRPDNDVQIAGFEKGGKNRYNNIWPFEHSRVRLQGRSEGACDYVNATHIKPLWSNKRYIASQGPLPATFEDFWSVIWDQDVRVIVMLTAESEGGQVKCHPYWSAQEYGRFKITSSTEKKVPIEPIKRFRSSIRKESFGRRRANTAIESSLPEASPGDNADVVVRTITLSCSTQPNTPARQIMQLQYSSWPDFGTTARPSHLLGIIELSNSLQHGSLPPAVASQINSDEPEPDQSMPPMLVHCSAGCGRTGTFCTVDSVIDILKRQRKENLSGVTPMDISTDEEPDYLSTKHVSKDMESDWLFNPNIDLIERTVADLRKQRISMVQSLRQYVLCYETVLEWICQQNQAPKRERSGSESLASEERRV
ncbi:hypothetical protein V492_04345 [Pseudogymnoascus sp. VKM F-4246]|nr:hypothetical protein V492_04345 [Pseudogymnoascus sp. VKM F-4246]